MLRRLRLLELSKLYKPRRLPERLHLRQPNFVLRQWHWRLVHNSPMYHVQLRWIRMPMHLQHECPVYLIVQGCYPGSLVVDALGSKAHKIQPRNRLSTRH